MHKLVFYLCVFLPYISASTKNPQPYTPTDYIFFNSTVVQPPTQLTSIDGRIWEDDDSKFSSPDTQNASIASLDDPYATQVPYMTARIFHSTSTYSFTVSTGPKFIRLYFHPATYAWLDKTTSYFSVTSNGFTLLTNFSAFLIVSAMGSSVVREEFVINVQNNQRLNITFIPLPNSYAFINGIEVFSVPNNLNRSDGSHAGLNPDSDPDPDPVPITSSIKTQVRPSTKSKYSRKTAITKIGGTISAVARVLSIPGAVAFRLISKRVKDVESTGVASRWGLLPSIGTKLTQTQGSSSLPSECCRKFSFAEIRTATNDFDDALILGVGGFGNVYKGFISGGVNPVAIKRLNPGSKQGVHEFYTEINVLSQLRYLNLVSLIGYCNDDDEMILVYEYVARGTLRDHLYNTDNPPLPWKKRLEICIGAARALNYLHTGAKQPVIHRDVKTTNILLDEKWVAKLSDFGLSKICPYSSHVTTVVKGSFGYLDPEYYRRQQLTEKSDVYSFGVVLCEVLCARPPIMHDIAETPMGLARWVQEGYGKGEVEQMVDPFLKGEIGKRCLKKFVEIAVSCLLGNGIERPSMNEVLWGLEFALQLQESVDEDVGLVVVEAEALMDDEKALFPISTLDGSDDMLSSSSGQLSSTNSIRWTIMSNEEQSFASDQDSGKWLANVLSGSKIFLSDFES